MQGAGPTGPGQVAIDESAADAYHLHIGDHVTVQTQGAPIQATIVGIVTVGGSSNLAGAVLSVFDPVTAAQVAGKPGFANQIDVQAVSGVSQETLAARIAPTLPKGFEAVTAKAVNKEQSDSISKALGFFNVFLLIFAGVALFVGLFIILNTFTMLVAQRTRELALLRAIGASRRQVMSAVLGEAAVVGVVASTVGLGLGLTCRVRRPRLARCGRCIDARRLAHHQDAHDRRVLHRRCARHFAGGVVPVVSCVPNSANRRDA